MALSGEVGQRVSTALGSLTIPSLSLHLRRVAPDSAMDLTGLLLDKEGAFSLTGFQDFMVRGPPVLCLWESELPGVLLQTRAEWELSYLLCPGVGYC